MDLKATNRRTIRRPTRGLACVAAALLITTLSSRLPAAEPLFRVVTDDISYNAGTTVRVRIIPSGPQADLARAHFVASIHYAGETVPVVRRAALSTLPAAADSYITLWRIPTSAKTGRYSVDVEAIDSASKKSVARIDAATSFAVHRKLVRIEKIDLGKTFYTPGDPISCRVVLRNLSGKPLSGLRVEFSERYWPWIARASNDSQVEVFPIVASLALKPGAALEVRSERAAVARAIPDAATQQYAVVVWDGARQNVLDIAFSPLTFIRPAGGGQAQAYPLQYVYPKLSAVDTASYRKFTQPEQNSPAIRFDSRHTMFAPGEKAKLKLTVVNPTDVTWSDVSIRSSLRALGSAQFGEPVVSGKLTLKPRGEPLAQMASFQLPGDGPGTYRAVVEIVNSTGEVMASSQLEIAANPMPKSVLIFCAHEDDEAAHAGMIRAAVENDVSIHLVYFTSGDAGSCDRYYQHSCSPAEALNFGSLRMEEARAGVGHLGVPRENIHFLGLPDGGSGEIWFRHAEPANPYLSVLLASDHAPYEGLEKPNVPYARRTVVDAAKAFIARLKPEVIYTGHPDERHVDHRTNNWFVVQAMQELLREGKIATTTELRVDQVYGPGPQKAAPYQYQKHILWVSPEARALAQEAGWFYQSQSGNRTQGRIRPLDQLPREEIHWTITDWKDHAGWNEND